MNLHFNACFLIIMCLFYIFSFFSAYFPFRWFGGFASNIFFDHDLESTNYINTPFGKNWLPRESSQQESVFESKPQQSKVQQTTSLTMVSHL